MKKMGFTQIESVLQTKNWSEPAKNRFSVALHCMYVSRHTVCRSTYCMYVNRHTVCWSTYCMYINRHTVCRSTYCMYVSRHNVCRSTYCVYINRHTVCRSTYCMYVSRHPVCWLRYIDACVSIDIHVLLTYIVDWHIWYTMYQSTYMSIEILYIERLCA